jgi:hypothetical protein
MSLNDNHHSFTGITAQELSEKSFPPLQWLVEGILPEGTYLLSARPKVGKSWLALDFAVSVANGEPVLGRKTCQGKAIYLALEDNQRRLQDRLKILRPDGSYATPNLILHTEWLAFNEGGLEELEELIKKEKPKLVVIDTLAKVRPPSSNQAYQSDYKALAPLTSLANRYQCCILIVTHNRKGKSDGDALEQVSGTLGLTGAVDGALIIDGNRSDKQYKLSLIGRDIPNDDELAIALEGGIWKILGQAKLVLVKSQRKDILDLLQANPNGLTPKEIAEALRKEGSTIRKLLKSMVAADQVRNCESIYFYPSHMAHSSNLGNMSNNGNKSNDLFDLNSWN